MEQKELAFQEYMQQTNTLLTQLKQIIVGLNESLQAMSTQNQTLRQQMHSNRHRFDMVLYALLRHDADLRTYLGQTLTQMTNPYPRSSEEYREFKDATKSLRTLIRHCQKASAVSERTSHAGEADEVEKDASDT
jgi:D-ribose pyranose/furanose isomerase RbsD